MQQVTRSKVEELIKRSDLVSTSVEQDKVEMRISLTLANNCSLLVKYNVLNKEKSYFMHCAVTC